MKIDVMTKQSVKEMIDKRLLPLATNINEMMMEITILKEEIKAINRKLGMKL